jgi:ketosteroid isomerase-like protein
MAKRMSNIPTVQGIYEAFSRGDVPAILRQLSPGIEWDYQQTTTSVPWLQHRIGTEAVAGFFEALGALKFNKFQPKEFLETGEVVVVLLDIDFTVIATGRRVSEDDAIHVWRFDKQGKVARYKHGVDSHKHELAWRGERGRSTSRSHILGAPVRRAS